MAEALTDKRPAGTGRLQNYEAGGFEEKNTPPAVDLSEAERFLLLLDEAAESWHFRTFPECRGDGRKYAGELVSVADALRLDNGNGRGVYVVVNEGDSLQRDGGITRIRAVFADFDPPQTSAMPERFDLEPHLIVESSRGKHHAYWLVDGLEVGEFKALQKAIVARYGSDPSVCNPSRVMRLPGFIHCKPADKEHDGRPFQTRIIHESGALPYAAGTLQQAFRPAPAPSAPAPQADGHIVDTERHSDVLKLSARLAEMAHRDGLSRDAALSTLYAEAMRGRWTREVPADELARAFDGAFAKYGSGEWTPRPEQAPPPTLVHVDISDIMQAKLPPPGFVFDTIIPRRVVTLLGGHGGLGKSMLGLTLCAHAACGRPWGPFTVDPTPTAYVSLEDDADTVRYRLRRIIEAYGLPAGEVIGALSIFDGTDSEAALVTEVSEAGTRRLSRTPMLGQMTEAVAGAGLVLVDNASDAFDGDENNRRQVRTFVRYLAQIARANDAGMVLLAHIDKNAARHGGRGNTYSGSTAWHNSARSRLALVEDEGALELLHEKAQFGPVADPLPLVCGDYGILTPGASDPQAREAASDLVARADAEAVFKVLELAAGAEIDIPTAKVGPRTTWHALADFPELPATYRTAEGKRRVMAALLRLERDGRIRREVFKKANRHDGERWGLAQIERKKAA